MANQATNRLRVEGFNADEVRLLMEVDKRHEENGDWYFSFESIIPMPQILDETYDGDLGQLHIADLGLAVLGSQKHFEEAINDWELRCELGESFTLEPLRGYVKNNHPNAIKLALESQRNFDETGFYNGYEWSLSQWGTRLGGYEYERLESSNNVYDCYFESAWTPAVPVIVALSQRFQHLRFRYYYLEEGVGIEGAFCYVDGGQNEDADWLEYGHRIYADND